MDIHLTNARFLIFTFIILNRGVLPWKATGVYHFSDVNDAKVRYWTCNFRKLWLALHIY